MAAAGLLSSGLSPDEDLPYPDFSLPLKLVIVAALKRAFERLAAGAKRSGKSVVTDEDTLTANLKEQLNLMLGEDPSSVPGFTADVFETVTRDSTVAAYDYGTLDKKPDLVFRLCGRHPGVRRREYYALFVECKIVQGTSKSSINLYCAKGVARFVEGQYSWAMRSALMLGYARDGNTIDKALTPALKASRKAKPDRYCTQSLPTELPEFASVGPVHATTHARRFKYVSGSNSPGPIQILHVWLRND